MGIALALSCREDWDSILDMTKFKGKNSIFSDPAQNIPTGTKSQFTRECNKVCPSSTFGRIHKCFNLDQTNFL